MALIVVLPDEVGPTPLDLGRVLDEVHPLGILPHHPSLSSHELADVLRRPPTDLGADVTDYLAWRGLSKDRETMRLVRRIVDLSADLRSVSAVARSLYASRRAIGRKLSSKGLPVPSHWLQASRLIRVAIRLQNVDATLTSVAYHMGYADGFSVSNQMERLMGCRPSQARTHLGWEWLMEAWLRREAEIGGLHSPVEASHSGDVRQGTALWDQAQAV